MIKKVILTVLISEVFFLNSCDKNIFSPLHIDNNSFEECMSKGDAAYSEGKFQEAKSWYEKAVLVKPYNSDARYALARTSTRMYGVNVFSTVMDIISANVGEDLITKSKLEKQKIIDLYEGTKIAQEQTKYIAQGNCTEGKVRPVDIYWDHTFVSMLKAISFTYKFQIEIGEILEQDIKLTVTADGISVTGWNDLTPEQQIELQNEVTQVCNDALEALALVFGDPDTANSTGGLLEKLKNLGP